MSFWDRVKNIATPYSDEDYDDYDEEEEGTEGFAEEPQPERPQRRRANFNFTEEPQTSGTSGTTGTTGTTGITSATGTTGTTTASGFTGQVVGGISSKQEVVLFHPVSFNDASKAADHLRARKAVIVNMENVDKAMARRVVDFMSGCAYAVDGKARKIAQSTYLFCPHHMDVVGDLENVQNDVENYL